MHLRWTARTALISTGNEFDYSQLAASVREPMQEEADVIRRLLVSTASNIVQIGLRLKYVRNCIGRHAYQAWLKAEFQWSQSMASNYMRAADVFCNVDCLDRLQPSALYILARRKAAGAARSEALARARGGEMITKSIAELIVNKHSDPTARRSSHTNVLLKAAGILESVAKNVDSLNQADRDWIAGHLAHLLEKLRTNPPVEHS